MVDINEFDMMFANKVVAHVKINGSEVSVESYNDCIAENPFARPPFDIHFVNEVIKERCFEEYNANADFFLKDLGLDFYDPWGIVQKTHGFMWDDLSWIRFKGEEHLTWEDVNLGR